MNGTMSAPERFACVNRDRLYRKAKLECGMYNKAVALYKDNGGVYDLPTVGVPFEGSLPVHPCDTDKSKPVHRYGNYYENHRGRQPDFGNLNTRRQFKELPSTQGVPATIKWRPGVDPQNNYERTIARSELAADFDQNTHIGRSLRIQEISPEHLREVLQKPINFLSSRPQYVINKPQRKVQNFD